MNDFMHQYAKSVRDRFPTKTKRVGTSPAKQRKWEKACQKVVEQRIEWSAASVRYSYAGWYARRHVLGDNTGMTNNLVFKNEIMAVEFLL